MDDAADFIVEMYALDGGPWTTRPVARGALGQIWKLSGAGSSWAVKELLFGCDEAQIGREAALRQAAESLGIASPRLIPNRHGAYVSHLPPSLRGSFVKLYDWIDGTAADASDPDILDWIGRTMALLHKAGEGTLETPDSWYEQCPRHADWTDLHQRVHRADVPWSDDLGRFIATSAAELAQWVTPADPHGLVTSHLDLRPQNVLVGPDGPVLLDWDNAGPVSPERELARAVYVWAGHNEADAEAARRLVRSYRSAGGRAAVKGPQSFSMLFATDLNYLYLQAGYAIDPDATAAQREFAGTQVVASLRGLPELAAVTKLAEAVES
ncbi:aminoglycoside phosphotransferase family protein [Streptomyces sp. NPDC005474]|uniref:phosphotransferase enzyme family protein n=1 Tax=Streptomyces sp. NPDC005474 TaxID=3154878 RepID=UPI0034548148